MGIWSRGVGKRLASIIYKSKFLKGSRIIVSFDAFEWDRGYVVMCQLKQGLICNITGYVEWWGTLYRGFMVPLENTLYFKAKEKNKGKVFENVNIVYIRMRWNRYRASESQILLTKESHWKMFQWLVVIRDDIAQVTCFWGENFKIAWASGWFGNVFNPSAYQFILKNWKSYTEQSQTKWQIIKHSWYHGKHVLFKALANNVAH